MIYLVTIAVAAISYLIGSINFSIILSKAIAKKDIRESGSGNAGATNMLRTYGKGMGAATLVLDVFKGIICVLLGSLASSYLQYKVLTEALTMTSAVETLCVSLPYIAGLFVILGHNFPLYFGFKGGKGVATGLGVVMLLDWKIGIIVAVLALLIMVLTRYVSLGSISAAALFVILQTAQMIYAHEWNTIQFTCVLLIGFIVIVRHHANIKRLFNGTENKLSFKKK